MTWAEALNMVRRWTSTRAVTIRKYFGSRMVRANKFGFGPAEFEACGGHCPGPSVRKEALVPLAGLGAGWQWLMAESLSGNCPWPKGASVPKESWKLGKKWLPGGWSDEPRRQSESFHWIWRHRGHWWLCQEGDEEGQGLSFRGMKNTWEAMRWSWTWVLKEAGMPSRKEDGVSEGTQSGEVT